MGYLPNSIERCTSILGYDPQAYIMGTKSNLSLPAGTQNTLSGPDKDTYGNGIPDKKIKSDDELEAIRGWKTFGKFALVAASVIGIGLGIKKGFPSIKKVWKL